ncbi:Origin recognition complex subunit 5 [Saguinus oedipus]|uniref:Origin recognition complex subunit 5 n=1 Tax=Saguinus oedipus TaxID=9490 RepID=A0ABQ9UH75_SAGOE|nr:Origin recognition complex subunit 5 [Saguinus oedipus]
MLLFGFTKDGCSTEITCETFNDFVRLFKQVTKAENLKDQTVYIGVKEGSKDFRATNMPDYSEDMLKMINKVLDKAEYLRDMEANLLPGFLRLQELCWRADRNVTVIFLSEIVWEKFRPNTGCFEPFVLYFPDYSIGAQFGKLLIEKSKETIAPRRNLQKILSHDHPPEYSADFYAAYINILLGVFYTVCRDLKELRHLKWCEKMQNSIKLKMRNNRKEM